MEMLAERRYQNFDILGIPIAAFESYEHIIDYISSRKQAQRKTFCVAINPEKIYCSRKDHVLRQALLDADIGICDGVGTGLAAKILHGRYIRRCTGADLFMKLAEESVRKDWSIFLLGATDEVNEEANNKLKEQYANIKIAGRYKGYFENTEEVIGQINASGADILFVAMGSPQQELWIYKHKHLIDAKVFLGVGGAFDIISGKVKRAPYWIRMIGLEFLYRSLQFPRRFNRHHRRPWFALLVIMEKMKQMLK